MRLIELLDLLLKDVENAARRVALLEPGGEWVGAKVVLCTVFIRFQGNYAKPSNFQIIFDDGIRPKGLRDELRGGWGKRSAKRLVNTWVQHLADKRHTIGA